MPSVEDCVPLRRAFRPPTGQNRRIDGWDRRRQYERRESAVRTSERISPRDVPCFRAWFPRQGRHCGPRPVPRADFLSAPSSGGGGPSSWQRTHANDRPLHHLELGLPVRGYARRHGARTSPRGDRLDSTRPHSPPFVAIRLRVPRWVFLSLGEASLLVKPSQGMVAIDRRVRCQRRRGRDAHVGEVGQTRTNTDACRFPNPTTKEVVIVL
jgi:hypothetical protein